MSFIKTVIKATNWNQLWESNFQPVVVDDFAGIRASFHEPIKGVRYEIVITPKMSFGTGHHATTCLMIRQMCEIIFSGKTVMDFGTGTGILSILAEKMGAASIIAIDNDEWSITNATENLEKNICSKIKVEKADSAAGEKSYDIILANINKNVIIDNLSTLVKQLEPGGILVLSGLLASDEAAILYETGKLLLIPGKKMLENGWISLRFSR
jgi:ribosomal protein L11 methyltransferase